MTILDVCGRWAVVMEIFIHSFQWNTNILFYAFIQTASWEARRQTRISLLMMSPTTLVRDCWVSLQFMISINQVSVLDRIYQLRRLLMLKTTKKPGLQQTSSATTAMQQISDFLKFSLFSWSFDKLTQNSVKKMFNVTICSLMSVYFLVGPKYQSHFAIFPQPKFS